jgi:hypothetical protein
MENKLGDDLNHDIVCRTSPYYACACALERETMLTYEFFSFFAWKNHFSFLSGKLGSL